MTTLNCDVAIIGAGSAGIAAEEAARRAGAKTLLIDDRFAGTTCATVGCMPSKLLIAAAEAAHAVRRAPTFGIRAADPVVDGVAVMQRIRDERDRFASSVKASLKKLPESVRIQARARFANSTTLLLGDGDGDGGREIHARAVVIATGSTSSVPKAFEAVKEYVLTNETIFELRDLPTSVAVIGAGPLGLEIAQALCRLGVETMVFDEAPHVSGIADALAEKELLSILAKEMPVTLGVALNALPEGGNVRLTWRGDGAGQGSHLFERVLLAAGRPPALSHLNLEATKIALDQHGSPRFDPNTLQCGGSSIFIAGDANHDRPVLHEASAEGSIAGRNAAAYPKVSPSERFVPMSIMFTDPPVAIVGSVPKPDAADIVMGCASYADQGRAKIFERNVGLAHLYADAAHGRLTGATLVAPGAEHSAHLIAWAIQEKMTATTILTMPFYHPTFEEGLKPALRKICSAVHAVSDDAVPAGE